MGLVTLTEILKESVEKKYAVGAFDTLDDNFTEAIVAAAEEEGLPVILMVPNFFADDRDERQMSLLQPAAGPLPAGDGSRLPASGPRQQLRLLRQSHPRRLHVDHV
ncbi:MAG: class II fructose-bisphosphate aldolase [Anaerotruncus massiliensis (ex Togo et al. 2019)]